MAIVVEEKRCGCCRGLFSLAAECMIITLTILHALMSALEILIHLEVIQVPPDTSESPLSTSTLSTTSVSPTTTNATINTTTSPPSTTVKSNPYDPGGSECRIQPTHPDLVTTVRVLQYVTLTLSALFSVEMCLKILYLQKTFLKDIGQVFDLMVVVCSLGVEVSYFVLHDKLVCIHPVTEVATFVILLRLWRIPRACNVRKAQYTERMEDEIHYLRKTKSDTDNQCRHLEDVVQQRDKQLDRLRSQLQLLDGGVYTGDDQTDIGVVENGKAFPNGGLKSSARSVLSAGDDSDVIAQDGGENVTIYKDSATVAFTADTGTGDKPSHNDLSRKDSDVNSKANDSGIDAKDSFRSDIETNGFVRGFKGDDDVFADSDGSETPVCGHRTIQEVEVQIEEPSRQKQLPSIRSIDGGSEDVALRRKPSDHFVPYFENAAYDADGDDEDELNASRTYRSADGVPMTEL